jgi:hypothetical protein
MRICSSVQLVSWLRLGFEADFCVMAHSRKGIYILTRILIFQLLLFFMLYDKKMLKKITEKNMT